MQQSRTIMLNCSKNLYQDYGLLELDLYAGMKSADADHFEEKWM